MKVKELIEQLKNQDPEKEVMIQQGEEYDYMNALTVKDIEVMDACEEYILKHVVVIEYS